MTPKQRITVAVMIFMAAIGLGWDAYVVFQSDPDDTISELIYAASHRWFLIPFAFGMCAAHFFFPRDKAVNGQRGVANALIGLAGVGIANGVYLLAMPPLDTFIVHTINIFFLILGAIYGNLFWRNDGIDGK